jgi:hypothetical protein
VVRLRIDLVEGVAAALDFGDDLVGSGFPDEGFGVGVPVLGPGDDRGGEFGDAGEDPRRKRLSVSSLNQRSIRFTQELEVGV